ncbi:hypothetical protein ScPMuIL_012949 [Solemya velum]
MLPTDEELVTRLHHANCKPMTKEDATYLQMKKCYLQMKKCYLQIKKCYLQMKKCYLQMEKCYLQMKNWSLGCITPTASQRRCYN